MMISVCIGVVDSLFLCVLPTQGMGMILAEHFTTILSMNLRTCICMYLGSSALLKLTGTICNNHFGASVTWILKI